MRKKTINSLQLAAMVVMMIVSPILGMGMPSVIKDAGVDCYISVILTAIGGIVLVLTFCKISNYRPDLPLIKKNQVLFGKYIGFVINTIILGFVIIISVCSLFNLVSFIVTQFLPYTPRLVIAIIFCFLAIYMTIEGIETISRVVSLFTFTNILVYLFIVLALYNKIEISNFKPILEFGFTRPINGAIRLLLINIAPFLMLLMIPKDNVVDKEKLTRYVTIGYIISIIILLSMVILTMGNLGIHLASMYQYPEYMIMKRVNLFDFLDRVENFFATIWIFGIFMVFVFSVYFISSGIKYNNKSKVLPTLITIAILFITIKVFRNNTTFNNFIYNVYPILAIISLIVIVLITVMILIKEVKKS